MVRFAESHDPFELPDDEGSDPFPLGDGTADTDAQVQCPFCWEIADLRLDPGSGTEQSYVEDCPVCCRPWRVRVRYGADGAAEVQVEPDAD